MTTQNVSLQQLPDPASGHDGFRRPELRHLRLERRRELLHSPRPVADGVQSTSTTSSPSTTICRAYGKAPAPSHILSQLSAYNDIKAQLNPPRTAPSQSLTSPLVNFFLGLASFIPEVGPVFGLADVAFNFGTSLTTDQQGNETIDLTSTIGNLLDQANTQFTDQATTTGTFFELVYQDWGKLSALGQALGSQIRPKLALVLGLPARPVGC